MHRYLIFALGIFALVAVLAPSLDRLGTAAPGTGVVNVGGDGGSGVVGPPVMAGPSNPDAGSASPATMATHTGFTGDALTIVRDGSGQFHTDAQVNGQTLRFLVDTGADTVALTEGDAQAVGLAPDPAAFRPMVTTASGRGYGAAVHLDRLDIAGHALADVDAVVVRGLNVSLLGQSALRRLGSVSMNGDRMVIGN